MESNDSPEIPDRGETSDIPGLPSGVLAVAPVKMEMLAPVKMGMFGTSLVKKGVLFAVIFSLHIPVELFFEDNGFSNT